MNDKIFLQGLEFYAYHGALPAENEIGQVFIVDIEMKVEQCRVSSRMTTFGIANACTSTSLSILVGFPGVRHVPTRFETGGAR